MNEHINKFQKFCEIQRQENVHLEFKKKWEFIWDT